VRGVFDHLQIYDTRERLIVGVADAALAPLRWGRARSAAGPVSRVLLLRLERIGDLLMVLDAIRDARAAWPHAEIDLAVGSWNAPVAALIPEVSRVEIADVPWLAREGRGDTWPALVAKARRWRTRDYDVVVNFEPDIRSNFLAWLTGAPIRLGYSTGGGGAWLTDALEYEPASHVAVNARQIVARAAGLPAPDQAGRGRWPQLVPPPDAVARAEALIGDAPRPLVGVHASGGRESKQGQPDRFAAVARELAVTRGATIVLTGSDSDRPLVNQVAFQLGGARVIDVCGALDLPALAALLARLDVLITGDTGPMHLASAMGTPLVALFGPSNPLRYGPLGPGARVIRIDLWCSPCGRVRLPPERCRGHVPDCLDGIDVARVVAAAIDQIDQMDGRGLRDPATT
jgi:ADP-heptose:LPS heptosyltransferase